MRYGSADPKATELIVRPQPDGIPVGVGIVLRRGRIHEAMGPAADVFAIITAAKSKAVCIWVGHKRDVCTLCPAGVYPLYDPAKFILIQSASRGEILWAAEQALRAPGGFTVVLDMRDALSLRESRRLQLAAEEGGGIGLVCLRGRANSSAAQTRWICEPIQAEHPTWAWHCIKGKNGEMGHWVAYSTGDGHAKDTLHLVPTAAA